MGGQKITNLNNGVNDNDAVNMSQLNTKVSLTGNETISGIKTFTNSMITNDIYSKGDITLGTSTNTWGKQLQFRDTTGKRIARIQPMAIDTINNIIGMWVNNADNTIEKGIYINSDGTTSAPASDVSNSIVTTINKSKATNGYFQLGNGLIVQWGRSNQRTFTYPIPFSNDSSFSIVVNNQAGTDGYGRPDSVDSLTRTSCTVGSLSGYPVRWIAVGY
jgi:hypothetical protein